MNEIKETDEFKEVIRFALFPVEVQGTKVWFKNYIEVQRRVIEYHDGCADCFSPYGVMCEKERSYWKIVELKQVV